MRVGISVDVGTWLADTLHHLPASSVCIVIALPDHSAETERWLCEFLDGTRKGASRLGVRTPEGGS
jgi:hypothetical protein